jgi:hypothetical protein
MSKPSKEPLRGEAAWRAAKKAVSDRNEAAYAQGREEKAAKNAQFAARRRAEEIQDRSHLPHQPQG